jgi:hypothetical protein
VGPDFLNGGNNPDADHPSESGARARSHRQRRQQHHPVARSRRDLQRLWWGRRRRHYGRQVGEQADGI